MPTTPERRPDSPAPERQPAPTATPEQRARETIQKVQGELNALRQQIQKADEVGVKQRIEILQKLLANPEIDSLPAAQEYRKSVAEFIEGYSARHDGAQKGLADLSEEIRKSNADNPDRLTQLIESMPHSLAPQTLADRLEEGAMRAADNPQVQGLFARFGLTTPEAIRNFLGSIREQVVEMLIGIDKPPFFAKFATETAAGLQWRALMSREANPDRIGAGVRTRWINCYKQFIAARRARPNVTFSAPELADAQDAGSAKAYYERLTKTAAAAPAASPENPNRIGNVDFGTTGQVDIVNDTPTVITTADNVRVSFRKFRDNYEMRVNDGTWIRVDSATNTPATSLRLLRPQTGNVANDVRVQVNGDATRIIKIADIRQRVRDAGDTALTRAVIDGSLNPFN